MKVFKSSGRIRIDPELGQFGRARYDVAVVNLIAVTVIDVFGRPAHAWADVRPDIVAPGGTALQLRAPLPVGVPSSWLFPEAEGDVWFRGHTPNSVPS